jgi:hypothetical protein
VSISVSPLTLAVDKPQKKRSYLLVLTSTAFPLIMTILNSLFFLYGGFSMAASFRRISVLLLLILQGSFLLDSSAQQPSVASTAPLQLTLKEAVQLALKQNPQRIIARLLVAGTVWRKARFKSIRFNR